MTVTGAIHATHDSAAHDGDDSAVHDAVHDVHAAVAGRA
jgi:hypothetical protein